MKKLLLFSLFFAFAFGQSSMLDVMQVNSGLVRDPLLVSLKDSLSQKIDSTKSGLKIALIKDRIQEEKEKLGKYLKKFKHRADSTLDAEKATVDSFIKQMESYKCTNSNSSSKEEKLIQKFLLRYLQESPFFASKDYIFCCVDKNQTFKTMIKCIAVNYILKEVKKQDLSTEKLKKFLKSYIEKLTEEFTNLLNKIDAKLREEFSAMDHKLLSLNMGISLEEGKGVFSSGLFLSFKACDTWRFGLFTNADIVNVLNKKEKPDSLGTLFGFHSKLNFTMCNLTRVELSAFYGHYLNTKNSVNDIARTYSSEELGLGIATSGEKLSFSLGIAYFYQSTKIMEAAVKVQEHYSNNILFYYRHKKLNSTALSISWNIDRGKLKFKVTQPLNWN